MMIAKERLDLQNLTLNSVLQVGKKSRSEVDMILQKPLKVVIFYNFGTFF